MQFVLNFFFKNCSSISFSLNALNNVQFIKGETNFYHFLCVLRNFRTNNCLSFKSTHMLTAINNSYKFWYTFYTFARLVDFDYLFIMYCRIHCLYTWMYVCIYGFKHQNVNKAFFYVKIFRKFSAFCIS